MKQLYKKAKNKLKDSLRPPSRQSVSASPARSPRPSEDLLLAHTHVLSTTLSTNVPDDQPVITPAPNSSPDPDAHSLGSPLPRSGNASRTVAPYAQPSHSSSKLATVGSVGNDLLTVAHASSDAFPPLKSVLGGILEIWKLCERTAEAQDEFEKLKSKLEALMKIADMYAEDPDGPSATNLSKRLERLASDISQLHGSIASKLDRGSVTKAAQSRTDIGNIKATSAAISSILEVFDFEASIAVERQVGTIVRQAKQQQEKEQIEKAERQRKEDRDKVERQEQERKETITAALKERHVPQAVYDAQLNTGCMKGTRKAILAEIRAWINNPAAHQICWLTGKAGSGKSSIAKTVCMEAERDTTVVLGGSFFCSLAAQRDIRCVVPTLAQLLAQKSVEFCMALFEMLEPGIQYKEVSVQIEKLLYAPLLALRDFRLPILFVIDALDECGGETSDGMLNDKMSHEIVSGMLEALASLMPSDPRLTVKFLVTSRPETHIRDTSISDAEFSRVLRLHAVNKEEVDGDIRRYITENLNTRLSRKPKIRAKFTESGVSDLVQFCDGLFIVAATALKHTFSAGVDAAAAKFEKLLNMSRDNLDATAAAPLDEMYTVILADAVAVDGHEASELPPLHRILASILSARMTLSITALEDLLELDVRATLSRLHAVVHVPDDDDEPGLRTVHASFGDYLFDRASDRHRILRSFSHEDLTHACLGVMGRRLYFNISKSDSSYEPNQSTQTSYITLSLEYACLNWAHHLVASNLGHSITATFDSLIGEVFRTKFLFWLEVLSILRKVTVAVGLLRIAAAIVKNPPTLQFLHDASSFVASSHDAIERSAPHIYLSALPFADRKSLIYHDFATHCTGLINIEKFGIGHHAGSTVMTLAGHGGAVRSVAYSPEGSLIASGSDDGTVRVWNTQTGEEALSPSRSGDGPVLSVDFARNGRWVASGTEAGIVCVWNVTQAHASHRRLSGHSGAISSVVFKMDSSCLASASKDGTIRLWNPETSAELVVIRGEGYSVNGVAFPPDGKIVASVSEEWTIRLWDSNTGEVVRQRLGHGGKDGVDFSPDGEMVAGSFGFQIFLCARETGLPIMGLYSDNNIIHSVRFSPDGRFLVAAHDRGVRLWTLQPNLDDASWVDLGGHLGTARWATFSPDGRYIAAAFDDGTVRILSATSDQTTLQLPAVYSVATSGDGAIIVNGSEDALVRVWDAQTGEATLPPLRGHGGLIKTVAISPDGRLIASGSGDCTVRLWDAQSGATVNVLIGEYMNLVEALAFSHNGRWLASASGECVIDMWDVTTGQYLAISQLRCHGRAKAVTFSLDDGLVATADSSRIYLWHTENGEQAYAPLDAGEASLCSLAISPDSTRIVSTGSDTAARIWDITAVQCINVLDGHTSFVLSVAWSNDGRFISTGSEDSTLRLWDATGAPLAVLHGHNQAVRSTAFTSDGQFIISGSRDTMIRKWDVHAACRLTSKSSSDPVAALAVARLDDGWLVGSSGELLLWVPSDYRPYYQTAVCPLLIGKSRVVISAGDSGLHVGSNWTLCWPGRAI